MTGQGTFTLNSVRGMNDHLMEVYEPDRLRIVMVFNPRGGISSKLTVDSDWGARGGEEKYRDWVGLADTWSVSM